MGTETTIGTFGLPYNSAAGDEVVEWAQLSTLHFADISLQRSTEEPSVTPEPENGLNLIIFSQRGTETSM